MKKLLFIALLLIIPVDFVFAGKGYSGGGRSSSAPSRSYSSPSKPSYSTPGKSYSSNSKPSSSSIKPKGGTFDQGGAAAQKRAASKSAYTKGDSPKNTYTTPTGKQINITNNNQNVVNIRNMPHESYVNREVRIHTFYQPYYSRPIVVYNDPYNSFFWWWMLDRSLEERAYWAYCHRKDMDEARYHEMLKRDIKLEARIKQLEAEKKAIDPNYLPKGIDHDLPYTDDYVNSVINPNKPNSNAGIVFFWIGMTVMIIASVLVIVWLIFFANWGDK